MKKLLFAALLALTPSHPVLANDMVGQAPQATMYVKKGGGFFGVPAPWTIRKAGPDKARMNQIGSNVTSGVRLFNLARLQTAAYAIQKGYGYFSFSTTQNYLMCNSLFNGDPMVNPIMSAQIRLAKTPGPGLEDAKAIWTELAPVLSVDASEAEKDETFRLWSAACVSNTEPGLKNLFKKKDFGSVTDHGIVFAIQH